MDRPLLRFLLGPLYWFVFVTSKTCQKYGVMHLKVLGGNGSGGLRFVQRNFCQDLDEDRLYGTLFGRGKETLWDWLAYQKCCKISKCFEFWGIDQLRVFRVNSYFFPSAISHEIWQPGTRGAWRHSVQHTGFSGETSFLPRGFPIGFFVKVLCIQNEKFSENNVQKTLLKWYRINCFSFEDENVF